MRESCRACMAWKSASTRCCNSGEIAVPKTTSNDESLAGMTFMPISPTRYSPLLRARLLPMNRASGQECQTASPAATAILWSIPQCGITDLAHIFQTDEVPKPPARGRIPSKYCRTDTGMGLAEWAIWPCAHYNVHWGNSARFSTDESMASSAKAAPAKTRRPIRKTSSATVAKRAPRPRGIALDDPSLFINRELSLLDFQRRVLEEAQDSTNPSLDRVMFLSFVGSNLDEFFMVRVAGLKRQIEKGVIDSGPDAMGPAE